MVLNIDLHQLVTVSFTIIKALNFLYQEILCGILKLHALMTGVCHLSSRKVWFCSRYQRISKYGYMRSANDNVQDSTLCTKEIVLPFSKKRISKKNNHIQTLCLIAYM